MGSRIDVVGLASINHAQKKADPKVGFATVRNNLKEQVPEQGQEQLPEPVSLH